LDLDLLALKEGYLRAHAVREVAKARLAALQVAFEEMSLRESRGELIPAAEAEQRSVTPLKVMVSLLETLPDLLERDADLSAAAVERVQVLVDRTREELHRGLLELAGGPR
jgi:hypothetical protein